MSVRAGRAGLAATLAVAAASLAVVTAAGAGTRLSGIQLTPDTQLYLISKDVGTDRWAITYDLTHRTLTGNVFPQSGGAPQFIWCDITSVDQAPDPAEAQYHLTCRFAESCASAPCTGQWGTPFEVPPVAGSFLLPTNTQSTLAGNVQPLLTVDCASSPACHAGGVGPDLRDGATYGATVGVAAAQDPSKSEVESFDPTASYLLDKVLGTASAGGRMPPGEVLPADEVDLIRNWILEGAVNN